jgi:TPR repeat protein
MLKQYDTLEPRTQVEHYWIYDAVHISDEAVVYRAEDMRLNRDVLLKEYFPSSLAKRHRKEEGGYTVYAHPTDSSRFQELKAEQAEIARALRWVDHPDVASVSDLFEANGTLYTVFRPHKATPLHRGFEAGRRYTEKEIVHFARSLTGALIALRERGVAVTDLHAASMEVGRDTRAVLGSRADLTPMEKQSEQESIRDLGLLLAAMMRGRLPDAGEESGALPSDGNYSPAIRGLVTRMISEKKMEKPKSLSEIQLLLEGSHSAKKVLELMQHGSRANPLSSAISLGSLAVIVLFGIYMLYYHPKSLDIREISLFDNARFHLAAYLGNSDAQRALGEMYEKGYGVEQDRAAALEWYYEAANKGDLYAQLSLGHLYERGFGVPKDNGKAAYWFHQAAKQGDAVAQYNMGQFYSGGRGVPKDSSEAQKWFAKAAAREIRDLEAHPGKVEQARGPLRYDLAVMYLNGLSVPRDYGKAFLLARGAAAGRHIASYYLMGYLYENGYGVGRDYREAVKWYEKGARMHGDRKAQAALGTLYTEGLGVPADHAMAVHWFSKAARQGDAYGAYALARAYETGKGVAADSGRALHWYRKSAEGGYAGAAEKVHLLTRG